MSEIKEQKRPLTQEEIHAEAVAAEEAAKAEAEPQRVPVASIVVPAPEPEAKAEVPEPAAKVEAVPEVNTLTAQIAEKEARIAELTKRVRDEDGRRGGELTGLRQQIERLGDQLTDLMAENRELRQRTLAAPVAPPAPPEPDEFETQYPDLAQGVDRRMKPIQDATSRAEAAAKEAKSELQKLRDEQRNRDFAAYRSEIKKAVPNLDEIDTDPKFNEWLDGTDDDSTLTRRQILNANTATYNHGKSAKLIQRFEQTKTNGVVAPEPQKGPTKPTKEAQIALPKSAGDSPKGAAGPKASRLAELEDKLYRRGDATKEERLELGRLREAEARGELT